MARKIDKDFTITLRIRSFGRWISDDPEPDPYFRESSKELTNQALGTLIYNVENELKKYLVNKFTKDIIDSMDDDGLDMHDMSDIKLLKDMGKIDILFNGKKLELKNE